MTTIQEVAKLAGVSVGSVSHYINGKKLRPQTATSIELAIKKLNYKANSLGRNLRNQQSFSIGVLVNNIDNVFSSTVCTTIESEFQAKGYTTLILAYQGEEVILRNKIEFLLERQVDALIIVMSEQRMANIEWLKKIEVPIIIIDNPVLDTIFPCIVTNNKQSVYKVIDKMLTLGHERIGLVTPPDDTYVGAQRRLGWIEAYQDRNITPHSDDLVTCSYDVESGYQATKKLLDKGDVTAIFASNYYLSVGALKAIFEQRLTIGKEISFASFDDLGLIANITTISVTVVEQPIEEIAYFTVEKILNMFNSQESEWENGIKIFDSQIKFTNSIVRKKK